MKCSTSGIVNKYNLSEGYRIFRHLCSLFIAFTLNVSSSPSIYFTFHTIIAC
jgi:hypothetical protein